VQIAILGFTNALSCIIKIIGSISLLKTEAPDPVTFETSVWPYKCYYYTRLFAVAVNVLAFIAQTIVSSLAINNPNFYNEPKYGVCTFCYQVSECRTSYTAYIQNMQQTAQNSGMILNSTSIISFNEYFHRNMTA